MAKRADAKKRLEALGESAIEPLKKRRRRPRIRKSANAAKALLEWMESKAAAWSSAITRAM